MSYKLERQGSHLTVCVAGKLDAKTSPVLRDAMASELEGVSEVTFDLAELEYVSSAGLRVLLAAYKLMMKRDGTMRVVNAGENVMSILDTSGFADLFGME